MLAISYLYERHPQFLNIEGMKMQPHMKYVVRHNTENDDDETLSYVIAGLALIFKNEFYTPQHIKEITLYNAKNKNVTKTVKTSELDRFSKHLDISVKFGKALRNYSYGAVPDGTAPATATSTAVPTSIQNLIHHASLSLGDDAATFPKSNDSEQDTIQHLLNISMDYGFGGLHNIIKAYMLFDDKDFIIFNKENYEDVKTASEQFKSLGFHETCSVLGDTRAIMAVNDKMMFNLKMSLDATIYDSLNRIKV